MTFNVDYVRNYLASNQGSEDDLVMLNMMSGGKPMLTSTTEPRVYRARGEYNSESAFATNSFAASMMGAWDAEVGRPAPEKASESYRRSYAAQLERMSAATV
ncbi:hypothetical protein G6L37_06995 [Agrobacterium rubi]|nr:hypothetical protein [Agrobacterium rubi]NTF25112.1 hypothetical protein [Agrobacterium rubi]